MLYSSHFRYMYKFENNTRNDFFSFSFTISSQIHTYPTRTSSNLHTPIGNLKTIYRTVWYSGHFLHYTFNLWHYLLAVGDNIHCILNKMHRVFFLYHLHTQKNCIYNYKKYKPCAFAPHFLLYTIKYVICICMFQIINIIIIINIISLMNYW